MSEHRWETAAAFVADSFCCSEIDFGEKFGTNLFFQNMFSCLAFIANRNLLSLGRQQVLI